MSVDKLRFRSASKEDFSRYARNLAWLLHEPLQDCQELLARIYGYSNLHELQEDLRKPGESGPFDEPLTATNFDKLCKNLLREPERSNRLLYLIAKHKGCSLPKLAPRFWDAREIGLFCAAPLHREYFQRIKSKHEVISETNVPPEKSLCDYIIINEDEDGKFSVVFTSLGRAVFDAVVHLLPAEHAELEHWHQAEDRLWALCTAHRCNPWPFAMFLEHFGSRWWQGQWDEGANSDQMDANPDFLKLAPDIAKRLLPTVKTTFTQFIELYRKGGGYSAHHHLRADAHAYPAFLYWAGRVGENAGDYEFAHRCFTQLKSIEGGDRWGARFSLATLRLERGRGSVKGLFNTQNGGNADLTAWEQLALAAEAYVHGELSSAKKHFGAALCEAWATAEPFGETLSERALLKFSSNASSPANIQEFMHQTATFWRRHPEAFRFFSTVVQAPAVRTALLDYHRQRAANFGIGLRASIQEISQAQQVEDQLKHLLQQFVNQSP